MFEIEQLAWYTARNHLRKPALPLGRTRYYFGILVRGPNAESFQPEELERIQEGHMANIDRVVASHIHCAPEGVNGPVGVTRFLGGPATVNGVLASGSVAEPDAGNACGWTTLEDVLSAAKSGSAYVNVHTIPFPPGEIRGQLH